MMSKYGVIRMYDQEIILYQIKLIAKHVKTILKNLLEANQVKYLSMLIDLFNGCVLHHPK